MLQRDIKSRELNIVMSNLVLGTLIRIGQKKQSI